MKLATTTGDFSAYTNSYLEQTKHVQEAGFRYLDLSLYTIKENDPLILSDNWRNNLEELKEYTAQNHLEFVQCHSPGLNPLDKTDAEKYVAWNVRSIEICAELGIPNIVVHSGWNKELTKEEWFKVNKGFFEKLFPAMEKHNVCVLHENTTNANIPWFHPKTGAEMAEFSHYVNHPLFHSCWDTGHANIEGNQYEDILALGDDLYAVHINDNRGHKDEHLIPFFGTLNMDEIMHALKDIEYKGVFTFEAISTLRPSQYWLGNRRSFPNDTRLLDAALELQKELEKFMYTVGKHILSAYNEFEG